MLEEAGETVSGLMARAEKLAALHIESNSVLVGTKVMVSVMEVGNPRLPVL